jgi:hypothetical protein
MDAYTSPVAKAESSSAAFMLGPTLPYPTFNGSSARRTANAQRCIHRHDFALPRALVLAVCGRPVRGLDAGCGEVKRNSSFFLWFSWVPVLPTVRSAFAASADAARSVRSSVVKYTERLSCIRSLPWLPGLNTPSVFIILLLID